MPTRETSANPCLNKITAFLKNVAAVKDAEYAAPVNLKIKIRELPAMLAAFNLSSYSRYQF